MSNINPEKPRLVDKLKNTLEKSAEILGLIVAIGAAIASIAAYFKGTEIVKQQVLISIDIINILILVITLCVIRPIPFGIKPEERDKLKEDLNLQNKSIIKIESRVNQLVKQLVHCILKFAAILGIFYLLQLVIDIIQHLDADQLPSYAKLKPAIENTSSIIDLLHNQCPNYVQAAKYLSLEILTNSANLFSAAYLFLAFQVLFIVTLAYNGRTWKLKGRIPFGIAILITVFNITFFIVSVFGANLLLTSHIIRLIGGIYNGVAMSLLFSRFISMEYFFKNSNNKLQRVFYLYGTVIILPLYVVAQPLYGVFNVVEFGKESPELFKSIVFLVCFWGKLVFLLFIYTMLKKRWIHAYLFLLLSQKNILSTIAADIEEVEDLQHQKM